MNTFTPVKIGEPFNPWRGNDKIPGCGFYPPDAISRIGPMMILKTRRKFSDSHKLLYTLLVRRAGRDGHCFPSIEKDLAPSTGRSPRSVKMLLEDLEAFGLIGRRRRGRENNEYTFIVHLVFLRYPGVCFEVQTSASGKDGSKCKDERFEVQDPVASKCKNQQFPYKEETRTDETRTASQPAGAQFAEELKRLVNGYRHPAGGRIPGCSRVALSDGPLLDAVVAAARDRGLSAGVVASVWARRALAIAKRADRPETDDPAAYFRNAILDEIANCSPTKINAGPPGPIEDPVVGDEADGTTGETTVATIRAAEQEWGEETPPVTAAPPSGPAAPRCVECDGKGIRKAAADPVLSEWCTCPAGAKKRTEAPDAVDEGNAAVVKLRERFKSPATPDHADDQPRPSLRRTAGVKRKGLALARDLMPAKLRTMGVRKA